MLRAMATEPKDYSHHVREHPSSTVRATLVALGTVCVGLGVVGLFVPMMPGTVFLIVAAACFARASKRFYNRLLNSKALGPLIVEWQEHRSIPYKTKIFAIVFMAITFGISIYLVVRPLWLQLVLAAFGVGLAVYLYRIPSRPDEFRE